MKTKIWIQLPLLLSLFLITSLPVYGGVIFEENFDSLADWNVSRQYQGNECVDPCTTAPKNWTNYRVVDGSGTWTNPTGSVRVLPSSQADHTTSTSSGKAYVVYNQSHPVDNWPGDSELVKKLGGEFDEIYLRLYMRTQANWKSVGSASSKVFRIQHYDGTGNVFQNFGTGNNAPIALMLLGQMGDSSSYPNTAAYIPAMRCDPQASVYYCDSSPSWMQNDVFAYINTITHPAITSSWGDAGWHRWDLHLKMNTVGSNNGVYEVWFDGTQIVSHTDAQWRSAGSSLGVGWNLLSLGGNSSNSFATQGDQWYAIDDVVVSTTPIPANYVIGAGAVTSPTAPKNVIGAPVK
jgi:hypothetical protein